MAIVLHSRFKDHAHVINSDAAQIVFQQQLKHFGFHKFRECFGYHENTQDSASDPKLGQPWGDPSLAVHQMASVHLTRLQLAGHRVADALGILRNRNCGLEMSVRLKTPKIHPTI